jgi:hypothetical protein
MVWKVIRKKLNLEEAQNIDNKCNSPKNTKLNPNIVLIWLISFAVVIAVAKYALMKLNQALTVNRHDYN